jgi:hypothetical protein
MNWDDFRQAFNTARNTMDQADRVANDMADMLDGRLRKVSGYRLAKLKRQLRDFNIHTGNWNEKP